MDALALTVQRHYARVCKVALSNEEAQEISTALAAEIDEMAAALEGEDRGDEVEC